MITQQQTRFSGPRYSTRQIADEVPLALQIFLWGVVDELQGEKDYLQVFSLSLTGEETPRQRIIHTQEEPSYECEHHFPIVSGRQGKVYVICDGTHATMLFSHEY